MKKEVHVAIVSSDKYAPYTSTALLSILKNIDKDRKCNIYILTGDMSVNSRIKIDKLKNIYNCSIQYCFFKDSDLAFCKDLHSPKYIDKVAASRLLLPSLFPDLNKIICIEADMFFRDDISKLYDVDIGDYYIGAVEDFARKIHAKELWDNEKDIYFNTGVMLVNMKKLREISYKHILECFAEKNKQKYKLKEQDLMNDAYKNHIFRLNIKWNFYHEFYSDDIKNKIYFEPVNQQEYNDAVKFPSVIHTPGEDKLWYPHFKHPYKNEWLKLYKKSGFYSFRSSMKYNVNGTEYSYYRCGSLNVKCKKIYTNYKSIEYFNGMFCIKKTNKYKKIYVMHVPVFYRKNAKYIEKNKNENNSQGITAKQMETIYQMMFFPQKVASLHQLVFPQFKNIHENEDVVVVGCGTTLPYYVPINNAKHIALNRSLRYEKIKFDYAFVWDFPGLKKANDDFENDFLNYECVKFAGKFLNDEMPIPEYIDNKKGLLYRCYSSARHKMPVPTVDPVIHADLSVYPLMDFMSIAFGGLHFASWTHPKRIFLVGLDTSSNGSFDGRQNPYHFKEMFQGYNAFKRFMDGHYPETEIISVNPVGLKGIFHDVYTQSYLDEHPEILKEDVEVLNTEKNLK